MNERVRVYNNPTYVYDHGFVYHGVAGLWNRGFDDPQRAMNDIPEVVEGILNKLSITPQGSASQTPVQ